MAPHSLVKRSLKAPRESHCASTPAVSEFWASTHAAVSGESGSSNHLQHPGSGHALQARRRAGLAQRGRGPGAHQAPQPVCYAQGLEQGAPPPPARPPPPQPPPPPHHRAHILTRTHHAVVPGLRGGPPVRVGHDDAVQLVHAGLVSAGGRVLCRLHRQAALLGACGSGREQRVACVHCRGGLAWITPPERCPRGCNMKRWPQGSRRSWTARPETSARIKLAMARLT